MWIYQNTICIIIIKCKSIFIQNHAHIRSNTTYLRYTECFTLDIVCDFKASSMNFSPSSIKLWVSISLWDKSSSFWLWKERKNTTVMAGCRHWYWPEHYLQNLWSESQKCNIRLNYIALDGEMSMGCLCLQVFTICLG